MAISDSRDKQLKKVAILDITYSLYVDISMTLEQYCIGTSLSNDE